MTREEANNIARGITDKIEATTDIDDWAEFWGFTRDDYEEFLDMAIKALEQEDCESLRSDDRTNEDKWVNLAEELIDKDNVFGDKTMQIVIDIPEEDYKWIKKQIGVTNYQITRMLYNRVRKSIPLPKGHGRLIDADDIRVIELEDSLHIIRHEKGDEIDVYIDAPTIIDADKESEE